MNPDAPIINLLSGLSLDSFWGFLKLVYILAFTLYAIFASIVLAQVHQMEKTFIGGFEKELKLFSYLHLFLAALALLWSLVVL